MVEEVHQAWTIGLRLSHLLPDIAFCTIMNAQICLEEPVREEITSLTTPKDITLTIQQQLLLPERCDPGPSALFIYGSSALPKVLLHSTNSGCAALSHMGWLFQDSQCLISLRSSHSLVSVLKNEYYQTFLFIRYLKKICCWLNVNSNCILLF